MKMLSIAVMLLCILASSALAAETTDSDAFTVYSQAPIEGRRITPYLQYQMDKAWELDNIRVAKLSAIQTERELVQMQRDTREKLLRNIGGLPTEKTALNAKIVGTIPRDGYRIEKLVYESQPGFHVSALVCVPDGPAKPHPAILLACGHAPDGKSAYYHGVAASLARRGYIVLVWDAVGQGERSQFWDASKQESRYNRICGEHAVFGNLAYLAGANLARWEIWDGVRALDYLLTRPDVDSERISITGTSGGGFQSAFIGALDPRIDVIAPSCFIISLAMRMNNRIFEDPDSDPEQDIYRMVSDGIDLPGVCLMAYPRPLVLSVAVEDFFPIEGARKAYREISDVYRMFGKPERTAITEGYHRHSFSLYNRKTAFAFIDRFSDMPIRHELDPVDSLGVDELKCAESGQVLSEFGGRNITELVKEYYLDRKNTTKRELATLYQGDYYPGIDDWRVMEYVGAKTRNTIEWEKVGSSKSGSAVIDRYLLYHSELLSIPLLHIRRPGTKNNKTLFWFDAEIAKASAKSLPEIEKYLDKGYDIVSFDFRALGENRMLHSVVSVDDPSLAGIPFNEQYTSHLSGVLANYVYNSLLTGRPYFLQLIEDAEIAEKFARSVLGARAIEVTSNGDAYSLAYSIAEVLPEIELLEQENESVLKWSEIVESEREVWPIWYLLPEGAYIR